MSRREPRVLIVSLGGTFGGVEHYLTGLARFLEDGAKVYILTQQPELQRRLRQLDVRVIALPEFTKALRFPAVALLLPLLFIRHRIDILQLNGYLDTIFVLWGRLCGRTVICTRHGDFDVESYKWYRQPQRYFPRWLCRVLSRYASCVVCVSETVGREVVRFVDLQRVRVIRNWVEQVEPFHSPVATHAPFRLLYVGRLERYKGIHLVLEAMRTLPGVQFTVVGDGPYRAQLEEMAQGMPVTFTGFQADPAPFFREAELFVMPSLGPEGLPLSPIEAMAVSLPVLLSSLPVHEEISAQGTGGALFESGNADDLRAKIVRLQNLAERQTRARVAHTLVEQCFSAPGARQAYRKLFSLRGTE